MGPGLFPSRYVSIHSGGRGVVELLPRVASLAMHLCEFTRPLSRSFEVQQA